MSSAKYTALPSSESCVESAPFTEKPRLLRNPSATPYSTNNTSSTAKRYRHALILGSTILALVVLTAALYGINVGLDNEFARKHGRAGCHRRPFRYRGAPMEGVLPTNLDGAKLGDLVQPVEDSEVGADEVVNPRLQVLQGFLAGDADEKKLAKRAETTDPPTFSTSTYSNGDVSSFVYTTRPIVNPGGYTIGTFTGYQHISEITTIPSSASTLLSTSASAQSTSVSSNPTSAPLSTTTLPPPPSSVSSSTTTSPTSSAASHAVHNPKDDTSSIPVATALPLVAADPLEAILQDLANLVSILPDPLVKRDTVVEEVAAAPQAEATPSPTGTVEFSTSVDKRGSTHVLVKTTRPIVNPAGYTIGTLEGAYVPFTSTETALPTPAAARHEELKKREE